MSFKAAVCGMEYHNIDGTGWPDAVVVENEGDPMAGTYEVRSYYPVDTDMLLALAEEMGRYGEGDSVSGVIVDMWRGNILDALGVEDG